MRESENLVFQYFNSETALLIGNRLIDIAKENNYIITIDISSFNHQLFHYSFDGTTPDRDVWIKRKRNVVQHFFQSSLEISNKLKKDHTSLKEKYGLSNSEYSATGGSVPIVIKNTGVMGAITVAGLTPEEDHNLVVDCIKWYLKNNKGVE